MRDLTTGEEKDRLTALEKTIRSGQKTFVAVGLALAEIKERKLYRQEFNTFDQYCKDRWGWQKAYCNHLIRAADTVKSLPETTATIVATETQARELAKAPEEKRAQVIDIASAKAEAEDRPMTAKDVGEAVAEVWKPEPTESDRGDAKRPVDVSLLLEQELEDVMERFGNNVAEVDPSQLKDISATIMQFHDDFMDACRQRTKAL